LALKNNAHDGFYFAHARTALFAGLQALRLGAGNTVLIPEFTCQALLQPFIALDIAVRFYQISDCLAPDWGELESLMDGSVRALVMVHYFGQPQEISKYRDFCDYHKIFLIEDNAHGFGGSFGGQILGRFGDIGISSPRKSLGLDVGGILYWNLDSEMPVVKFPAIAQYGIVGRIRHWVKCNPKLKEWGRHLFFRQPTMWDPSAFEEPPVMAMGIPHDLERIISEANTTNLASYRREQYMQWGERLSGKGLRPVFERLNKGAAPLCYPAYSSGADSSRYWFDWGWRNRVNVFSWPTLPREVIVAGGPSLRRWQQLVCFPIEPKCTLK